MGWGTRQVRDEMDSGLYLVCSLRNSFLHQALQILLFRGGFKVSSGTADRFGGSSGTGFDDSETTSPVPGGGRSLVNKLQVRVLPDPRSLFPPPFSDAGSRDLLEFPSLWALKLWAFVPILVGSPLFGMISARVETPCTSYQPRRNPKP